MSHGGDGMLRRRRWIFIVAMNSNTRSQSSAISRAIISTITRRWRTTGTRSSVCLTAVWERDHETSVINVDDPYGVELADVAGEGRPARYSLCG